VVSVVGGGPRALKRAAPRDAEPLVEKNYGDSFGDTTLEAVLSGLAVGRLVVVGAQTDACIRSTLHGAFVRGYDATLVSDAHTTEDQTAWGAPPPDQVIAHTNLYWTYQTAPGRTAGTVETKDVDFGGTTRTGHPSAIRPVRALLAHRNRGRPRRRPMNIGGRAGPCPEECPTTTGMCS
jgi:Isochorismatase family